MKRAVDVVLLPSEDINQLALSINETLSKNTNEQYLFKAGAFPHITVLMGLADEKDLPLIERRLQSLAKRFSAPKLEMTGVTTVDTSDNKEFCWLDIKKSDQLQAFHDAVCEQVRPLFSYDDAKAEMFYSPPMPGVPRFWTEGFAENNIQEHYQPHISLGFGRPHAIQPQQFVTTKLALGHVGNHGTCRAILWSTNLKPS